MLSLKNEKKEKTREGRRKGILTRKAGGREYGRIRKNNSEPHL